ncbi:stress protein [Paenibacillus stellifer]|uniref:Stress protein n=1 Tax=Paenibacillus stellifer TaxID=169760 RepID=A0A089LVS8_9BACL|nr:hypothetical protein [Paenibacillus stellifer]AIQ63328.1 stress protein [Paenibacillus stellifer]
MFKRFGVFLIVAVFIFSGCSSNNSASSVSLDDVIAKFKAAGLEAENATDITNKTMGMAPMKFEEGKRILVPSLGEDAGGRVFVFKKTSDLEELKSYYDELGKSSAMLFSHTYVKGNVLLQMSGDMEQEQFDKYKKVMDEL